MVRQCRWVARHEVVEYLPGREAASVNSDAEVCKRDRFRPIGAEQRRTLRPAQAARNDALGVVVATNSDNANAFPGQSFELSQKELAVYSQSCQSPSYKSPAINTSFTCSDNATSTRLISASRVALRMRSAGASGAASSPRSGLSRCKSAQWRKRKASTGQAGSPASRSATASTSADRRIGCGIGRDLSLMSHDGYHICNSACEACDVTG